MTAALLETPAISVKVLLPGKAKAERLDDDAAKRVLTLTYEDFEKLQDKCKLTIDNYDLRFPDDPLFDRGNGLTVAWGYVGKMGPTHELVITNWTPGPVFTVEALDRSVLMNTAPREDVYFGKTYSGIVREIAARNGYGAEAQDIDESGVVIEAVAQHNRTDWQFIAQLAREVSWQLWVDGAGLHFVERKLGTAPVKVLTYRLHSPSSPLGDLLEFPAFENPPAAQPASVQLKGKDPLTKTPIGGTGSNTETKRDGLGKDLATIDGTSAQIKLVKQVQPDVVAPTSAASATDAKKQADGLFTKSSGTPIKCTLKMRGDAHLPAKSVVEVRGIGLRLSGNYYLSDLTHSVAVGAYTMSGKARRDGTSAHTGAAPGVTSQADVNKKKGAAGDAAADPQPVHVVDGTSGQVVTTYKPPGAKGTT